MSLTIARSTVTTWRSLPAEVWLLVAARAVNRLGAFTLPFLSVTLVAELGASVAQAGYLLAAFGLATIPSRLLGGRLSDRWGTARRPSWRGWSARRPRQLLVAGSQTLTQAAVAVVLLGLAFEVYEPPSQSLVADATSPEDRPVAFGLLSAALAAAGMVRRSARGGAGGVRPALAVRRRRRDVPGVRGRRAVAAAGRATRARRPDAAPARPWRDRRLLAAARPRHGLRRGLPADHDHPAAHRHRRAGSHPRWSGCC